MQRRLTLLAALAVALAASPALAQTTAPALATAIDIELFQPGPNSSDTPGLYGAQVPKKLSLNAGLFVNDSVNPLTVGTKEDNTTNLRLVKNRLNLDVLASLAFLGFAEVGVAIPVTAAQSGDPVPAELEGLVPPQVSGGGLGDIRLVPKVQLYDGNGFAVALAATVWLPTGRKEDYIAEGLRGGGTAIAEYTVSKVRLLANAGIRGRPTQTLFNLTTGPEFTYGVGAELLPIDMGAVGIGATASLAGAAGFSGSGATGAPLELLVGGNARVAKDWRLDLGIGRGITTGYGTPDFRIYGGARYAFAFPEMKSAPEEEAKTTLAARAAANCAFGPEDMDGFQDDDACNDPDNDQDGILDAQDMCPNEPETKNGYRDEDGCPDESPKALDAVAAKVPALEAPADSDGDGVVDQADRCPREPEDADGFQDFDGCPEPDNDLDGIPDSADKCPLEAETINGVDDNDGCPDKGDVKLHLKAGVLEVNPSDKISFVGQSEKLSPKSTSILEQTAAWLRAHPDQKLNVEVHVDEPASEDANQKLSDKRAESVKAALVKAGLAPERVEAKGFGNTQKVDTSKSKDAAEQNRRVVLKVSGGAR